MHRIREENLELAPTEHGVEAGMSREENRYGAPADKHVQHRRAGDLRRGAGDNAGKQVPEKAARPVRIAETKQRDRAERLAHAARQQRLQVGQVDHNVVSSARCPGRRLSSRFSEGRDDRSHVTAIVG